SACLYYKKDDPELLKKQLIIINSLEKRLGKIDTLNDDLIINHKKRLNEIEKELKQIPEANQFTNGTLKLEKMKFNEAKSKYHISEYKAYKEKLKYYRSYRFNYLKEIERTYFLFNKNILN
ncbi:MAG: hypothetical protein ACOCV1_08200, partial [Bacillota bacterium]